MPQQIKVLAMEPDDLSLSPMTHRVEEANQLLQVVV